jgi:hypothetical protein
LTFKDFDLEIENLKDSEPEQVVLEITTAGTPITFVPNSTKPIQNAFIQVPRIGPNSGTNSINRYILYNTDGGTVFHTLFVGESIAIPGIFSNLKIDASHNGMKVEVEVRS